MSTEERKVWARENGALTMALHPHREGCGPVPTERGGVRIVCVCSDAEHRSRIATLHELGRQAPA